MKRFAFLLVTLVAFAALTASPCLAAEASATATSTSTAPVVTKLPSVGIQWWMEAEPGQAIAIVSAELDASTKLPVRVRLPIPPGMTVDWAGEISGGDLSEDIQRNFTVGKGEKGDYAEFELSKYRVAQIDLSGRALEADGPKISMDLEYVQSVPADGTEITVRLPAGATEVKIEPAPQGAPSTNTQGESLYTLAPVALKPGESLTTNVEYAPAGSQTLPEVGRVSRTNGLLFVLASLTAVAAIVLAVVVRRQKRSTEGPTDAQDSGTGDAAVASADSRGAARPAEPDSDDPFLLDD